MEEQGVRRSQGRLTHQSKPGRLRAEVVTEVLTGHGRDDLFERSTLNKNIEIRTMAEDADSER
jgi:hypothetical protein